MANLSLGEQEYIDKLRAARTNRAMEGQRRVVTMLFMDVVGSTAMAENLDPEDWAEIMDRAFDVLIPTVYRYEGTVARLMGDGLLAFFGAPIAHENDPERAILAGLAMLDVLPAFQKEIQRDIDADFKIRIGINTGTVVVGGIGSDYRMEYTAMGDAVNVASRMESTAKEMTIQVSEDTYKLAAPLFEFKELGDIEVKGKSEPIQTYQVLEVKAEPGRVRGIAGLDAPMIGREDEFEKMRAAAEMLVTGRGGIVTLIGEAGLGKSRLVDETKALVAGMDVPINWIEACSVSYDTRRPYGLFQSQLRDLCGIADGDSPEEVREKSLENIAELPETIQTMIKRQVELLLDIEMGSGQPAVKDEAFQAELFEQTLTLWQTFAELTPQIVVYDDIHWSDPASIELLLHMLQLANTHPILFICVMRHHREAPGWQVKLTGDTQYPHCYTELVLKPLSSVESSALVNNLLTISDLPEEIFELVLRKAEGNPFYVEEVVRTLIEEEIVVRTDDGMLWKADVAVADIAIPDNLQALLLARIDRLEEETRRTLQMASVIGRSFYFRVLEKISDMVDTLQPQLIKLQQVELISEQARLPELEYIFRHELTRDAAYESILKRNRREFHLKVAGAMEQLFADRLEEEAHLLGLHYEEAREWEKALAYYRIAGDHSARLYANAEAEQHYGKAIELCKKVDDGLENLIYLTQKLGRVYEVQGKYVEALALYDGLVQVGKSENNEHAVLLGMIPQITIRATYTSEFSPKLGEAMVAEALPLAEKSDDFKAQAQMYWNVLLIGNFARINIERAHIYGEKAVALAREHDLKDILGYVLHDLGRAKLAGEDFQSAYDMLLEAGHCFREEGNLPMLADNLGTFSQVLYYVGEFEKALTMAEEGLAISERINNSWNMAYTRIPLGIIRFQLNDYNLGIKTWQGALKIAKEANFMGAAVFMQSMVAMGYLIFGAFEKAKQSLDKVLEDSESISSNVADFYLFPYIIKALLLHELGHVEQATKLFEEFGDDFVLHSATAADATFKPYSVGFMAELYYQFEQYDKAIRLLDSMITELEEKTMGKINHSHLYRVKGKALEKSGEIQAARDAFETAYQRAKEINFQIEIIRSGSHLIQMLNALGEQPDRVAVLRLEVETMFEEIKGNIPEDTENDFMALPDVAYILGA